MKKNRIAVYVVFALIVFVSNVHAEFAAFNCRDHIENIQVKTGPNRCEVHVSIKNVSSAPQGTAGKWFKKTYNEANHMSLSRDLLDMLKTCVNVHVYYSQGSNSELVLLSDYFITFYFNR